MCLDSLRRSTGRVATLVVDNGSTDDSASKVEAREDPDVVVIRTGTNLGYAGGNNLGLSMASTASAGFTVVVNPDATIDPNCIGRLVDVLRSDPSIGLASPAICYASSNLLWYGGANINPITGSSYHLHEGSPLSSLSEHPCDTGRASGCILALAPDRIKEAGLLDEQYFLYYEEAEWSLRIRAHGLRIVLVPTAVAWHDVGHGSGGVSPTYQYYMTRNRLLLASQHGSHGALGALPVSLRDSAISLLAIARGSRTSLRSCGMAILQGYLDFVRRRFGQRRS